MTDYQSVQMLALNFGSRTSASRRLAHGLIRVISAFSSFIRVYLDTSIKTNYYDRENADNSGNAANTVTQLCTNILAVFECIRKARLKLSISKRHFVTDFLGKTITPEGVSEQVSTIIYHDVLEDLNNSKF